MVKNKIKSELGVWKILFGKSEIGLHEGQN